MIEYYVLYEFEILAYIYNKKSKTRNAGRATA